MLATFEGVYRDGRVELNEAPASSDETRVRVTFLEDEPTNGRTKPIQG